MPVTDPDRATREAYDAVASDYARLLPGLTTETPLDRAVLSAFVRMAEGAGGPVVEVGCGSGRISAHLADAGLRVLGLDLSPGMAAVARSSHLELALAVAHAGALPLASGAVGGLVAWYSLIHLPTDRLPAVLAEFARVTRAGAPVVVAFQSGAGERVDRTTSYGRPVALSYHRHAVADVAGALEAACLGVHTTVHRGPVLAHETTPQAFLLAQRR